MHAHGDGVDIKMDSVQTWGQTRKRCTTNMEVMSCCDEDIIDHLFFMPASTRTLM